MTKLPTCVVITCLLLGAVHVFAQDVITIRVAEFPPNYFKDDAGKWTGLSVELAEAIVNAAGLTPELVELPWSRAMMYLQEGKLHYMTNLSKTDERSEFLHWIGPVRPDKMGLIVKKDNEALPIKNLDDFVAVCNNRSKQFGIQKDIVYTEEFEQRMNNDPEFTRCFTSEVDVNYLLDMTVHERILGFFELRLSLNHRIQNDPVYKDLTIHPYVLRTTPGFHGISKVGVTEEILKKLRDGYAQCLEDGTIQRIVEKWDAQ